MRFKTIYIWYGLPVFLVILWLGLVFYPISSSIKAKEIELAKVRQESKAADISLKTMIETRDKEAHWKKSIDEFKAYAPELDRFSDVMKEFKRLAQGRGVAIEHMTHVFDSVDIEQPSTIITPSFEMEIKGRFMEMGRFLEEIVNQPIYRGITKAQISYNEKEYPVLTGKYIVAFKAMKGRASEGK
jgi:hypothetical protein